MTTHRERLQRSITIALARRKVAQDKIAPIFSIQDYIDSCEPVDMSQWDNVEYIADHPRWRWHR